MEDIRTYILRVVIAAMITGVLSSLTSNGSFRSALRLVCGIFLSGVVLQPFSGGIPEISLNWTKYTSQKADELAQEGSRAAQSAMEDIITGELKAYILDKAASLDTSVEVNVQLNEDLLPEFVQVKGDITTSARRELEKLLEEELGVPKENQAWTG